MKKSLAIFILLAVFAWCETSYGMGRILVFKGTIKASKTIFDVNDTNNLTSGTIQGYWVVEVAPEDTVLPDPYQRGQIMDSGAIVYDTKSKYFKLIPDSIGMNPFDPCHIMLLNFNASDADGEVWFDVVGKGKLTKYTDAPGAPKDFIPTSMKGTGLITSYDFFDPNNTYTGPITASLKLDSTRTRSANTNSTEVDSVLNNIGSELAAKGYTYWPDLTPP